MVSTRKPISDTKALTSHSAKAYATSATNVDIWLGTVSAKLKHEDVDSIRF